MNYPPGAAMQICVCLGNPGVGNDNARKDFIGEWFRCRNGTMRVMNLKHRIFYETGISYVCNYMVWRQDPYKIVVCTYTGPIKVNKIKSNC